MIIHRMDPDSGRVLAETLAVPDTAEFQIYRFGPGADEMTLTSAAELYTVNFRTGARRTLAAMPRGLDETDRMSVHPDGRVAMMLSVGTRQLVLIENLGALVEAAGASVEGRGRGVAVDR
jgi:hypothetical protein